MRSRKLFQFVNLFELLSPTVDPFHRHGTYVQDMVSDSVCTCYNNLNEFRSLLALSDIRPSPRGGTESAGENSLDQRRHRKRRLGYWCSGPARAHRESRHHLPLRRESEILAVLERGIDLQYVRNVTCAAAGREDQEPVGVLALLDVILLPQRAGLRGALLSGLRGSLQGHRVA